MNTSQVQLKVSLSEQLNDLLKAKAARLGVPVTQFVKHLILQEVKDEEYPTYQMTAQTEEKVTHAMGEYKQGKAVEVENISEFFKKL